MTMELVATGTYNCNNCERDSDNCIFIKDPPARLKPKRFWTVTPNTVIVCPKCFHDVVLLGAEWTPATIGKNQPTGSDVSVDEDGVIRIERSA